jgi:hypothetical protein
MDRLFATTSDLTIRDKDSIAIFLFSKKLIDDLDLDCPYELVENNQWTWGKMQDMMRAATLDINSDGAIDWNDRIGLYTANEYARYLFNASGEFMAAAGADGVPEITIFSERAAAVTEAIKEIHGGRYAVNAQDFQGRVDDIWATQNEVFADNRALFLHARMGHVTALRDMASDFGILPAPKFDSRQESFHSVVGTWTASGISIPHTIEDRERTGLILEALVYESRYTLLPAYYDINLRTKMARDEESSAMIDIILDTRLYDLGELYNWGEMSGFLQDLSQGSGSLATFWERAQSRAEGDLQRTLNRFGGFE